MTVTEVIALLTLLASVILGVIRLCWDMFGPRK